MLTSRGSAALSLQLRTGELLICLHLQEASVSGKVPQEKCLICRFFFLIQVIKFLNKPKFKEPKMTCTNTKCCFQLWCPSVTTVTVKPVNHDSSELCTSFSIFGSFVFSVNNSPPPCFFLSLPLFCHFLHPLLHPFPHHWVQTNTHKCPSGSSLALPNPLWALCPDRGNMSRARSPRQSPTATPAP